MHWRRPAEFPDTYEKLLAVLHREHPTWTRKEVEQYIADQQREQETRWAERRRASHAVEPLQRGVRGGTGSGAKSDDLDAGELRPETWRERLLRHREHATDIEG